MQFSRAGRLCAAIAVLLAALGIAQTGATGPYVVLVSLDGFRYDYAQRDKARHLLAIRDEGASARSLTPSFPSLTFPNHTSIITGLYPEHHGIVANGFYDPARHLQFDPKKSTSDGSWYGGTPLWVLAERQKVRTAAAFWLGSDAEIGGVPPSYWLPFDDTVPAEKRMQQVLDWLRLPASERPHFLTLYLSDADHAGHQYGPEALETRQAVGRVDQVIGKLQEGIRALALPVDLVVVSDHGMQSSDRVVDLRRYADLSKVRVVSSGPIVLIYAPDAESTEEPTRRSREEAARLTCTAGRKRRPSGTIPTIHERATWW